MARIHDSILHWGDKYDGPDTYKDGRRGGLEDAFWDEDELVDFPRKRRKKDPRTRRPGCIGNNNKQHVYVWTTERNTTDTLFYRYFRFHKYEKKICVGCGKQDGYRLSEQFVKKFKSTHKWSSAENNHAGYRAYKSEYIRKHGWGSYIYDWPW